MDASKLQTNAYLFLFCLPVDGSAIVFARLEVVEATELEVFSTVFAELEVDEETDFEVFSSVCSVIFAEFPFRILVIAYKFS